MTRIVRVYSLRCYFVSLFIGASALLTSNDDGFFFQCDAVLGLDVGGDGVGQGHHLAPGAAAAVDQHEGLVLIYTAAAQVATLPTGMLDKPTSSEFVAARRCGIGDHVWVGQSAMILKGTEIDSGSIIGAMSVVAGKTIGHNSSWGGNPARKISDSVFWDGACVHNWKQEKTQKSQVYASFYNTDPERYIYGYDRDQVIPFKDLDAAFDRNSPEENVEFLKALSDNNCKNRFVHEVS